MLGRTLAGRGARWGHGDVGSASRAGRPVESGSAGGGTAEDGTVEDGTADGRGVGRRWHPGFRSGSHPGARRYGGQAEAPGVMGSRTLVSCGTRLFTGGGTDPDTTARQRTAALATGNPTLTLE